MKPENHFLFFVGIVLAIAGVLIMMSIPRSKPTAAIAEPVKQQEYVVISSGIQRTDDLEKGVSCYKYSGGSMSCVKVTP